VQIEVGTRGIQPPHLKRYLDLAQRFASPILRVVVDTAEQHPSLEETIEMLRPQLADFQRAGVVLAIENHDRFSAAEFREMLRRLGSGHVGICLDTVNSLGALEGPEVVVATLAPWTVSLHVKDFTIRRVEHQMGFVIEGRPAGEGRLNVPWLLAQLQAAGRRPNAILELWPSREPTLEATIAKEHEWVARSLAYLRGAMGV
jgi:sugar phosphate isomerase/epimerase